MGAYPDNTELLSISSKFTGFEKEIYTPSGPIHSSIAVGEVVIAADPVFQIIDERIEKLDIL